MNNRLSLYLDTAGRLTPEDFREYCPYGPKHNLCVFCEEPHLKYIVISNSFGEKSYGCEDCAFEIDAIDLETLPKYDTRSKDQMSLALDAIHQYINTGLFPKDIHEFCVGGVNEGGCVFCGRREIGTAHFLEVPQGEEQTLYMTSPTGICSECKEDLTFIIQRFEEEIQEKSFGLVTKDMCYTCTQEYFVTIKENTYRINNGNKGRHTCNDCLENCWGELRFAHTSCVDCQTSLTIDLTELANGVTYTKLFDTLKCSKCKKKDRISGYKERLDQKSKKGMIEIEVSNPNGSGSMRLLISEVPCGDKKRFLYSCVNEEGNLIQDISCNYSLCSDQEKCGCKENSAEAAHVASIQIIQYLEEND